ncbi:autotransporter outer membrane beta-barrel domain-containing protein, partial [Bartonella bilalgolemii]
KITLGNVNITSKDKGLEIANGANFAMESGSIETEKLAVKADGKDTKITLGNVNITSKDKGLEIANGANFAMESGSIETEKLAVKADGEDTKITLGNVNITSKGEGIHIENGAQIVANGGSITVNNDNADDNNAVAITACGKEVSVTLNDVKIFSNKNGIEIGNSAILNMTGGSIEAEGNGVTFTSGAGADDKSKLKDTKITVTKGDGLNITDRKVSLENVSIQSKEGRGLYASGAETDVTMKGGTINASKAAFVVEDSAKINISNVSATASKNGLVLTNGAAPDDKVNNVNFTNTKLTVEKGVGIFREVSGKDVVTLKNSEIRGDLLLKYTPKEDKEAALTLNADHSVLEGRAETGKKAETVFNLSNGTIWTLKISKEEREPGEEGKPGELLDISTRSRSTVSVLNLDNSTIVFDKPTDDQYQVLHVGPAIEKAEGPAIVANDPNNPATVYNAKGDAKIYFNTEWSNGLKTKEQKTDRLVINGDALGTTTVYVNGIKGKNKAEKNTSVPANESGVSLIQVSGEANEDSFKLANGYTTINNSPYKYTLNAYGPQASSHGEDQSMFGENQTYW